MLRDKIKKGNVFESVLDNIEEIMKYNCSPIKSTHREVIGMKRRMQYYKRLKREIYDPIMGEDIHEQSEHKEGRNVWFCWLQGLENAPDIVKACYKSVEKNVCSEGNWNLVLITEQNINEYIQLPQFIMDKYKQGIISPASFSDLVRLELLIKYGGLWTDSTVFWTGNRILSNLSEADLFLPNKWIFFNGEVMKYDNWLIYAKTNQRNLLIVQKCLYTYWEKYDYLLDYFIFHLFLSMTMNDSKEEMNSIPYLCVHSSEFLQVHFYEKINTNVLDSILKTTDIHKLNYKDKPQNDISGTYYEWILKDYRILE